MFHIKVRRTALAIALATALAAPALADVTLEERVATDGFGPMKLGAMEGTTVTAISAERARIDSQLKFKSRLLNAFGGGGDGTAQIIRLDEDRQLELDLGRKQYTETTFQSMRDAMGAALGNTQGAPGETPATAPSGAPIDESQCEWSTPEVNVSRTGARAQLAGFDTQQALIVVSQTCTDRQTRASCDFVYSIDQWLAAEMPGGGDVQAFWQAYAQKLGVNELASSMQARGQQVFSRYKDGWGEALQGAAQLEGYPLKTTFSMQVGGPECAQTSGGPAGEPGVLPTAGGAAAEAGTQTAASAATSAAAQKAAEEAGGGIAGGIAGSAAGAFGGSLASGLLNRMRRKDPEPEVPAEAPAPSGNMAQLFRMTTETVAVRMSAIPPTQFDIPAGFRKVER